MEDLDKFCGGDIDIMDCPRPFFGAVIGPGSGERRPRTRGIGCFSMNRIRVTYLWGLAWPSCCQWKQAMIAGDGQRSFHAWRTFALLVFGWGCCQPTDSSRSLPFGNIARAVVLMTSAPWSEMSALRLDAADELQVCSPATTDRFNRSRRTQHPPCTGTQTDNNKGAIQQSELTQIDWNYIVKTESSSMNVKTLEVETNPSNAKRSGRI